MVNFLQTIPTENPLIPNSGVLSGFVGAFGNFGGVIFAVVFRFNKLDYGRSIWILGIVMIAVNLGVSWIRPIPRSQR